MGKFDHFDLISPLYDLVFGRRIDNEIVTFADLKSDQVLLDIGGGTGRVSILFKENFSKIFVIDSSVNMLKEAKAKGLSTLNSNSERLPFDDESVHRIIMVDALHHVKNQEETLREMWRILKPQGKIIIEEPDINNFIVKLIALGEKILLMRSHFIAPKEIAEMFNHQKLAKIDIEYQKGNAWIIVEKGHQAEVMEKR
jgi:demethylmenaquinone methyltransferase/2-methoxy-6-polyprenyl-1,4-benzoquinol methylase